MSPSTATVPLSRSRYTPSVAARGQPMKPHRQQTCWIWRHDCAKATRIRVGWIHNRHRNPGDTPARTADVVRLIIVSANGTYDLRMQPWEAVSIIAGLSKPLAVAEAGHLCEHKPKKT